MMTIEESGNSEEVIEENTEGTEEEESIVLEIPSEPISDNPIMRSAENNVKIATSLAEFKSAVEDSTTTTIYLDTDIIVPSTGLTINPAKTSLIIDGTSPVDGTVHAITDYNSSDYSKTIALRTNATLQSIVIRNIMLYGKNYYGTFCIYSDVKDVKITYDNIRYYGPQLTYNINGTAHYIDSYIEIGKFGGVSAANELAEARNVIFEGSTTVSQIEENYNEIIYSAQSGTIEIASNSSIVINTFAESGFFFGASSTNFIVHDGADFQYYGPKRFWENVPFKSVTVKPHARLYIEITSGLAYNAMLRIDGSLNVESESELILLNRGSSIYWPLNMNGGNAYFRNPKRVVLYSSGIRPLYYGIRGDLFINAQQIRYWKTAKAISAAGGFGDIPNHHWNKLDNSNLEISGTITSGPSGNFDSFRTNYDPSNTTGKTALNDESFDLVNARVLAFGRLPLTAEYVPLNGTASEITGLSEAGANIQILFTDDSGSEITLTTTADSSGIYRSPLNYTIKDGTIITIRSNKQFLTSETTAIVSNNLFQFHIASNNIEFEKTYLSHETRLVKRNDPDWDIVITDGRGVGSSWSLSVQLITPLSYTDEYNDVTYTLDDALVFIDDTGNINTLTTDTETHIYSHKTKSEIDITMLKWSEDKGILALIKPGTAYINIPYTGSILWILKDAP